MQLRPILKSLLTHHKTSAALIVVEIALTCAIVCNAVFLISQRLERIREPSGMAESELSVVKFTGVARGVDPVAQTRVDLATLRALPGVRAAATVNELPFGGSSWNSSLDLRPHQPQPTLNATMWLGSEDLLKTMGLRLLAGRDFRPGEYVNFDGVNGFNGLKIDAAIITRALAHRLFPGKSAVGKAFYMGDEHPIRVIGVVERLRRPNYMVNDPTHQWGVILPVRPSYSAGASYLIRTAPDQRAHVLGAAVRALENSDPNRILLSQKTYQEIRAEHFRPDRAMAWLLVTLCAALLLITALGIVGLASFWVQQRTRQIGVRRALGATRSQILGYFQLENLVLTTAGIAVGMALAYAINLWLMKHYALPRLPAALLPIGAVVLWALGQIAVLAPARRAAAVPPAVATRSV